MPKRMRQRDLLFKSILTKITKHTIRIENFDGYEKIFCIILLIILNK